MSAHARIEPELSRGAVDEAAHRRADPDWLAAAWDDPRTRVLVMESGQPDGTGWRALLAKQSRTLVTEDPDGGPRLVLVPPHEAPAGERYLLGVDPDDPAIPDNPDAPATPATTDGPGNPPGRAYFAVRAEPGVELKETRGTRLTSLRDVGALLDARDTGLLTRAVALANWHLTHRFCPRCGAPTDPATAGHVRVCRAEGTEHFPRTDPAVIMLVHADDGGVERCLLAHNQEWPAGRYSVLAGFVEAGESVEQAVAREVAEEVGITVVDPVYLGSQPWPFPRSLMLGFTARAVGPARRTDHTEISEVRWFSRAELHAAAHSGEVLLPGQVSIARKLIEHWCGGTLPGGW